MEEFLQGSSHLDFQATSKQETYTWISQQVNFVKYFTRKKKEKGVVIKYLEKISGYSNIQVKKLVKKKRTQGHLKLSPIWGKKHGFKTIYSPEDIRLLAETDNLHDHPTGQSLQHTLGRAFSKFGDERYVRLQNISLGHIYNLRSTDRYKEKSLIFTKTHPVTTPIGIRKKPRNEGKPGYLRVDSVHQGDSDKQKGVYHINSVDEVTQWEIIASVEKISEAYLEPILKLIIEQYPFVIIEFHADNGSEYINYTVARLLNKLLIKLTKSRSRQTNDNALVESKNGSVIRKHMGYFYINQRYAPAINDFYTKYFNPYLNFHRPCGFATTHINSKGKQKKIYNKYSTPYEALKRIKDAGDFLKPGITLKHLYQIAMQYSDNEYANIMDKEKTKLFDKIGLKPIDF